MRGRQFGSSGGSVPVLGIGTWNMEQDDPSSAIAAIRRAVELGMVHVDTAEMYGSGAVETLVGEAIAGVRDRVFLVSKVLPRHASYAQTLRACEASLERLPPPPRPRARGAASAPRPGQARVQAGPLPPGRPPDRAPRAPGVGKARGGGGRGGA